MKSFQKGSINIWLIVVAVILVLILGYFLFIKNTPDQDQQADSIMPNDKYSELIVVSPNGGEKIPYGSIVMAGDLGFTWKSQNVNYTPTQKFKAYLLDSTGTVVRSDFIKVNSIGNGVFASSFVGEAKIKIDTNYKIKVCDEVNTGVTKCDESDNYFTLTNTLPSGISQSDKPSIIILSPNGGETLSTSANFTVKWSDDRDAGNFDIYVTDLKNKASGTELMVTYNNFARSSGIDGNYSYLWKVNDLATGKYKMQICKSGTKECVWSHDYFTILTN